MIYFSIITLTFENNYSVCIVMHTALMYNMLALFSHNHAHNYL